RMSGAAAVAYARLPLRTLTATLDQVAVPEGSYLALRQGNYNVSERGAGALSGSADALSREVGKSGLRTAAAVPDAGSAPFQLGAMGCLVLAGVLAVLALLALVVASGWMPRPGRAREATAGEPQPTFGQTLEREAADAPAPVAAARPARPEPEPLPDVALDPGIFRAYDIRGVVGTQLPAQVAARIGQAIGSLMAEQGLTDIVVGRDGRLSGPDLVGGLIEGLRKAGRNVIDVGMVPTPVVYFAAYHLRAGSGVAV